ncbi:hypothetical protein [Kribbella karoonensis]
MDGIALLTSNQWAIVAALGTAVQGIASAVAVAIAVVAAKYAANQVKQARAQVEEAQNARFEQSEQARSQEEAAAQREFARREEQAAREERRQEELARPFVVVDFEPSPAWANAVNLVFENLGKTLAKNVRFTFDPPLKSSQSGLGFELADTALIKSGVPAMPPGRRIEALFDLSHERINTELPMTYRVKVDCEDANGRRQETLEYVLDLGFRYNVGRIDVKNIHHVAESLKKIEQNLKKWTANHNGVRVWMRDEKEFLAARAADFERWKAVQRAQETSSSDSDDTDDGGEPSAADEADA